MSIIKKSDVKNHVSARHSTQIHLRQPESQPDATGFSAAELGAVQSGPSIFTEDLLAKHSFSRKLVAPRSRAMSLLPHRRTQPPKACNHEAALCLLAQPVHTAGPVKSLQAARGPRLVNC